MIGGLLVYFQYWRGKGGRAHTAAINPNPPALVTAAASIPFHRYIVK